MKKNLGMFFGLSRCGAGAILLGLCAFTPVSRAAVIVNNTGNPSTTLSGATVAQVFTMSGTSGNLSSLALTLDINSAGTAAVDLFNVDGGGAPTTLAAVLGSVTTTSAGNPVTVAVNLTSNPLFTAGGSYAIALAYPAIPSASLSWDYTTTAGSGGTGSLGGLYYSFNSGSTWTAYGGGALQMNLQTTPVPEVPMTGVVMGFGALAIALGRKLRLAVSNIA